MTVAPVTVHNGQFVVTCPHCGRPITGALRAGEAKTLCLHDFSIRIAGERVTAEFVK